MKIWSGLSLSILLATTSLCSPGWSMEGEEEAPVERSKKSPREWVEAGSNCTRTGNYQGAAKHFAHVTLEDVRQIGDVHHTISYALTLFYNRVFGRAHQAFEAIKPLANAIHLPNDFASVDDAVQQSRILSSEGFATLHESLQGGPFIKNDYANPQWKPRGMAEVFQAGIKLEERVNAKNGLGHALRATKYLGFALQYTLLDLELHARAAGHLLNLVSKTKNPTPAKEILLPWSRREGVKGKKLTCQVLANLAVKFFDIDQARVGCEIAEKAFSALPVHEADPFHFMVAAHYERQERYLDALRHLQRVNLFNLQGETIFGYYKCLAQSAFQMEAYQLAVEAAGEFIGRLPGTNSEGIQMQLLQKEAKNKAKKKPGPRNLGMAVQEQGDKRLHKALEGHKAPGQSILIKGEIERCLDLQDYERALHIAKTFIPKYLENSQDTAAELLLILASELEEREKRQEALVASNMVSLYAAPGSTAFLRAHMGNSYNYLCMKEYTKARISLRLVLNQIEDANQEKQHNVFVKASLSVVNLLMELQIFTEAEQKLKEIEDWLAERPELKAEHAEMLTTVQKGLGLAKSQKPEKWKSFEEYQASLKERSSETKKAPAIPQGLSVNELMRRAQTCLKNSDPAGCVEFCKAALEKTEPSDHVGRRAIFANVVRCYITLEDQPAIFPFVDGFIGAYVRDDTAKFDIWSEVVHYLNRAVKRQPRHILTALDKTTPYAQSQTDKALALYLMAIDVALKAGHPKKAAMYNRRILGFHTPQTEAWRQAAKGYIEMLINLRIFAEAESFIKVMDDKKKDKVTRQLTKALTAKKASSGPSFACVEELPEPAQTPAVPSTQPNADALFSQAYDTHQAGQHVEAIALFKRAIVAFGSDTKMKVEMGIWVMKCYEALNQLGNAESFALTMAQRGLGEDAAMRTRMVHACGDLYKRHQMWDKAIKMGEKSLDYAKSRVDIAASHGDVGFAYARKGDLLVAASKYRDAVWEYEQAIAEGYKENPDNKPYFNVALNYVETLTRLCVFDEADKLLARLNQNLNTQRWHMATFQLAQAKGKRPTNTYKTLQNRINAEMKAQAKAESRERTKKCDELWKKRGKSTQDWHDITAMAWAEMKEGPRPARQITLYWRIAAALKQTGQVTASLLSFRDALMFIEDQGLVSQDYYVKLALEYIKGLPVIGVEDESQKYLDELKGRIDEGERTRMKVTHARAIDLERAKGKTTFLSLQHFVNHELCDQVGLFPNEKGIISARFYLDWQKVLENFSKGKYEEVAPHYERMTKDEGLPRLYRSTAAQMLGRCYARLNMKDKTFEAELLQLSFMSDKVAALYVMSAIRRCVETKLYLSLIAHGKMTFEPRFQGKMNDLIGEATAEAEIHASMGRAYAEQTEDHSKELVDLLEPFLEGNTQTNKHTEACHLFMAKALSKLGRKDEAASHFDQAGTLSKAEKKVARTCRAAARKIKEAAEKEAKRLEKLRKEEDARKLAKAKKEEQEKRAAELAKVKAEKEKLKEKKKKETTEKEEARAANKPEKERKQRWTPRPKETKEERAKRKTLERQDSVKKLREEAMQGEEARARAKPKRRMSRQLSQSMLKTFMQMQGNQPTGKSLARADSVMVRRHTEYTVQACNRDLQRHIEEGDPEDKKYTQRLNELLEDLKVDPREGRGNPEKLKYADLDGKWSRRITKKDRLVYTIDDKRGCVIIHSIRGHYK